MKKVISVLLTFALTIGALSVQAVANSASYNDSGQFIYSVESGDVLWRIGQKYETTWQEIAKANNLANPHLIFPGQKLIIPGKDGLSAHVPKPVETPKTETVRLDFLFEADFFGALEEREKSFPGAAKYAAYLHHYKNQNPDGTFILSAGDVLGGTPINTVFYGKPYMAIMNLTGTWT